MKFIWATIMMKNEYVERGENPILSLSYTSLLLWNMKKILN